LIAFSISAGKFSEACFVADFLSLVCMSESEYIHKSHNVSVLLYHVVCSAKYRRAVMDADVDEQGRESEYERLHKNQLSFEFFS